MGRPLSVEMGVPLSSRFRSATSLGRSLESAYRVKTVFVEPNLTQTE
jgi:hypothetical protein